VPVRGEVLSVPSMLGRVNPSSCIYGGVARISLLSPCAPVILIAGAASAILLQDHLGPRLMKYFGGDCFPTRWSSCKDIVAE